MTNDSGRNFNLEAEPPLSASPTPVNRTSSKYFRQDTLKCMNWTIRFSEWARPKWCGFGQSHVQDILNGMDWTISFVDLHNEWARLMFGEINKYPNGADLTKVIYYQMAAKPSSQKPSLISPNQMILGAKCINFIDIDTHHIFHTIFTFWQSLRL